MSNPIYLSDPIEVLGLIAGILERLDFPYCIGGSVASGLHGEWRATNDIDIVCPLTGVQASALAQAALEDFFADDVAIVDAARAGRSFNLIHKQTCLKVDFFPKQDPFALRQLQRSMSVQIPDSGINVRIASPEDVILAKLRWYRLGGEQSERQVRDIRAVLRVNQNSLDKKYLQLGATELGVEDLWIKYCQES